MQNETLGAVAFAAQYARSTATGRESWTEAVDRVEAMHRRRFSDLNLSDRIEWAFNFVRDKRVFPSQRSTQFAGRPIERNNMRMFNCTYSPCDRPRMFSEAFWLLLSGCGTGFSLRRRDVDRLPELISFDEANERRSRLLVVQDNIEGWAIAAQRLIDSYFDSDMMEVEFNYSQIRERGTPISSGGRAPGYKPLAVALENVRALLVEIIANDQTKLKPINCLDILMYLSEAVLSGGVRRSASIAIFDDDDEEMLNAKSGEWWIDDSQRAYANISAAITTDGSEDQSTVNRIINQSREWGEPGVAFFRSALHGTNPCAEIGLCGHYVEYSGGIMETLPLAILRDREQLEREGFNFISGWSGCNLTEINAALIKSDHDFYECCEAAAFIGTLQAAYTNTGYLGIDSKIILDNEALLGVSITGMCETPGIVFNPRVLRTGARLCVEMNESTAYQIGIKRASRVTCIKPSGNTSTIAGTSAGIHPYHSRRFIRRIRLSRVNPIWLEIEKTLPKAAKILDNETGLVSFALSAPEGSLTRDDSTALEHLERVRLVQEHWVEPGSTHSRVEGLTHNVSNTCTVREDEWSSVADYIWTHRDRLRGVALLPHLGDHQYEDAPYQSVEVGSALDDRWNELASLDWSSVNLSTTGEGEAPSVDPSCSGGRCLI